MKIGRRAFLQFAAGAVGGTLLSPIPWQLADDSAIWSQNWPWRPSPQRGPTTEVQTTCTLCEGGCGIQARLVDRERAILLQGNPAHPVNQGGICALCASGLQYLYAPYRVPQPLKQTAKRGDPAGLKPVTWAEALSLLGGKLATLRGEGNPHTVACITGQRRSTMTDLWKHFLTAYGSPNFFTMPAHADSLQLAASLCVGQQAPFAFAVERASYVLSFGANLIEGWGAAGRMQAAYGRWRAGSAGPVKLVQIESRCSLTASKADRWIPVSPGAEAAVATAIAHVLVSEKLYDADFVSRHVFGFENWTDSQGKTHKGFKSFILATEHMPEMIAKQAGVAPDVITALAKEFATREHAVAVWGEGQGDLPNNIYHDLIFTTLNILRGNLKPGGMVSLVPTVPLGPLPDIQPDGAAQAGLAHKRLDLAQGKAAPLPGNGVHTFLDALTRESAYPIEVLLVHEANPAFSLPETQLFATAREKVGFLVSFSSYLDETALQADLILPNPMALERLDDVIGIPGSPCATYGVASPILPPQHQTKHTGDVLLQLGAALGGSVSAAMPWKGFEEVLKMRVEGLAASGRGALADRQGAELWELQPGQPPKTNYKDASDLWKKLSKGACWVDAPMDVLQTLNTPSGQIEIAFQQMLARGVTVPEDRVYLPHFAPLQPSGDAKEYPLLLFTCQSPSLANGYLPNTPFMNKTLWDFVLRENDSFVDLHPETAASLGMAEGDRAALKTPQGEIAVRIHVTPGVQPGAVCMVQGLGHKAYDEYIKGKGSNANAVTEVQIDPVTGLGTVWATRAQLRRA